MSDYIVNFICIIHVNYLRITCSMFDFFWRGEAPAQPAVGDCPPLKELPEEGARRRRF